MRRVAWLLIGVALGAAPADTSIKRVRAGDDLQLALKSARPGDEIRLEAGATFSGNFVLPDAGAGDAAITVRTDLPDADAPPDNQRVTPQTAAPFAKIVSPNSGSALKTAPGAHHWRLLLLEFRNNKDGFGDIIQLGDGSASQSQRAGVPHDIVVDRVYIHGDPSLGQKRGIALNAAAVTIRNSHISDIKWVGEDSQAICGWNGPGPYTIENNYLEAAGETFLLGGADPSIADLVPQDVVVRHNHMSRPMDWKGSRWQIKNIFELKNARRVTVESNLFENNWLAAQSGYAIVLTPRNQDGKCPWCVVEEVDFSHNVVRNTSAGLNIAGADSPHVSGQAKNIRLSDNLFVDVTTRLGGNGWGVLIGDAPRGVTFDHNTFEFDGTTLLYAYGGQTTPKPIIGFTFTNNAAPHRQYGINGADSSPGTPTLARYFPDATVAGNWLSGGASAKYPAGNRFDVPFDAAAGKGAGADLERLRAMAERVVKGVM